MDELSHYVFEPLWTEGEFVLSRSVWAAARSVTSRSGEAASSARFCASASSTSGSSRERRAMSRLRLRTIAAIQVVGAARSTE